jgi:hypothetical protein
MRKKGRKVLSGEALEISKETAIVTPHPSVRVVEPVDRRRMKAYPEVGRQA